MTRIHFQQGIINSKTTGRVIIIDAHVEGAGFRQHVTQNLLMKRRCIERQYFADAVDQRFTLSYIGVIGCGI